MKNATERSATKRSTTMHRGADDERAAWMRKLQAERKHCGDDAFIDKMLAWGRGRVSRNKAKKGGL